MQMQQHYLTSMLAGLDSHASLSPTAVEVAVEVCTAVLVSRDIHFPHQAFLEVYSVDLCRDVCYDYIVMHDYKCKCLCPYGCMCNEVRVSVHDLCILCVHTCVIKY